MTRRLTLAGLIVAAGLTLSACSSVASTAPAASSTASTTSASPTPSASTSAYDPDGGYESEAAGSAGPGTATQEGSVTTTDGAFIKYYDGLQITPTKVRVTTPGPSQDAGTQTVLVSFHVENVGTAPVELDNSYGGSFNIDMTSGENRYDAQPYTGFTDDDNGPEALPNRLVPGTSADITQQFEIKEGQADVLRVTVSPNPMLYDFYTFTDVETLIQ